MEPTLIPAMAAESAVLVPVPEAEQAVSGHRRRRGGIGQDFQL
jgi:hypothetical protein